VSCKTQLFYSVVQGPYAPSSLVHSFSPSARRWTRWTNLRAPRGDAAVAALDDGRLLFIGGESPRGRQGDDANERPVQFVETFNPK
jgi:hypothetical protein